MHVVNPADGYAFESVNIYSFNSAISSDMQIQMEFDCYYPTSNSYPLIVRFFKSSSSYVDVNVTGSNNLQHITITNQGFYRLELFTRTNAEQTEYWISNIKATIIS